MPGEHPRADVPRPAMVVCLRDAGHESAPFARRGPMPLSTLGAPPRPLARSHFLGADYANCFVSNVSWPGCGWFAIDFGVRAACDGHLPLGTDVFVPLLNVCVFR